MLTRKELLKVKKCDQEYAKSFYFHPFVDHDVPNNELLKSNSQSKYALIDGFRTFLTVPTDDYPVLLDDGYFILPLCEEFLFHRIFKFFDIDVDQKVHLCTSFDFLEENINFYSDIVTNDQVECYMNLQLRLYLLQE